MVFVELYKSVKFGYNLILSNRVIDKILLRQIGLVFVERYRIIHICRNQAFCMYKLRDDYA